MWMPEVYRRRWTCGVVEERDGEFESARTGRSSHVPRTDSAATRGACGTPWGIAAAGDRGLMCQPLQVGCCHFCVKHPRK